MSTTPPAHSARSGRPPGKPPLRKQTGGPAAPSKAKAPLVDAARSAAFEVLCAVDADDAFANLLLPEILRSRGIDGRDAAFATELTYSTLRYCGQLDAILDSVGTRPVADMDTQTRNALRLGACQLLHLRTPEHAAIATSVDLVSRVRKSATGFVNAVLRQVQKRDIDQWLELLTEGKSASEQMAVRYSHPRWIVSSISDALAKAGRSPLELQQALEANNIAARPMLIARPGVCDSHELEVAEQQVSGRWSPYALTAPPGDPGALPAIRDGRAAVQDEGSQLVALLAVSATVSGSDELWLDACAGPGGKAALMAAVAGIRGASVIAVDQSAHRVELVKRACRPFGNVTTHTADAAALATYPWVPAAGYDRVLVDVPCTGIGALRRRPELRWRRSASDVGTLVGLQEAILVSALSVTRSGGVVTYSTCSPHVLETDAVVSRARAAAAAAGIATEIVDARDVIAAGGVAVDADALIATQNDGYLRLWPHVHGTDAMFAAVIRVTS